MTNEAKSLSAIAQDIATSLSAWRDELRVKIHLAGMDARDAWKAVEPHLELADARLRSVFEAIPAGSEKIAHDAKSAIHEARDLLVKVEPSLDAIGADLSKAGRELITRLKKDVGPGDASS